MYSIRSALFLIVGMYTCIRRMLCLLLCLVLFSASQTMCFSSWDAHKLSVSFCCALISSVNGPSTESGSNNTLMMMLRIFTSVHHYSTFRKILWCCCCFEACDNAWITELVKGVLDHISCFLAFWLVFIIC